MNIIISGVSGKMGGYVYEAAKKESLNIVCGIDKRISGSFDCPVYKHFDEIKEFADVIIDFSSPGNLLPMLDYAVETSTPLVICTTGYSKEQEDEIIIRSKEIPIFKASNTSTGVWVFIEACKILSEKLADYDVEIVEYHHDKKTDAPSGTSYSILNAIKETKKNCLPVFGRKGLGKRRKNEIGVHSVRGGGIVGEHEVFFIGENECVSIKHTGFSKALFADGALKAAKFIIDKKAGLYDMNYINRLP